MKRPPNPLEVPLYKCTTIVKNHRLIITLQAQSQGAITPQAQSLTREIPLSDSCRQKAPKGPFQHVCPPVAKAIRAMQEGIRGNDLRVGPACLTFRALSWPFDGR